MAEIPHFAPSAALHERVGKALAPLFAQLGEDAHEEAIAHVADQLASVLAEYAVKLHDRVKEQHGKHGLKRALPQVEAWAVEIAETVIERSAGEILDQVRHAIHGTKLPAKK